jgi:nucleoside-diphosphate-sugar epimerase
VLNNIIISGITGFVGINLKEYLSEKYKALGVSRNSDYNQNIISYTELNSDHFKDARAFVHLAGKAHDLKKTSEDQEYFKVNTELTIKLFDKFLESTSEIFIYMSSVKAVTDKVEGVLLENEKPNPVTAYGKSKLSAEKYLLNQTLPKGKKVYILRPCMIHGPGNKGNLNLLYQLVKSGVPYPLGAFENKRSFLSIENLCFVIQELLLKRPESGVFNIADDMPISTNKLIETIAIAIDKKSKRWSIPIIIVNIFAKIGTLCKLPFNEDTLKKLTENYIVSNSKIKEVLRIELPISTITGLINTIKSFNNK